jgi:Protein of unknown function (DUF3887)
MTQGIPADAADRAQALFSDLIEGRWEEARQIFDVRLNGQVDMDRFARGWTSLADSAGRFERAGAPVARQSGAFTVVDVPLTAGAGEALGEVVFNTDGKVAGLVLEYPRRHRLDPRRVRSLGLSSPELAGLKRTRI